MYEESTYGDIELFNSLEDDIIQLSNNDDYRLCLLGDFNAHTKDECDYVKMDNDIQHFLNFQDGENDFDKHILEEIGYPLQ